MGRSKDVKVVGKKDSSLEQELQELERSEVEMAAVKQQLEAKSAAKKQLDAELHSVMMSMSDLQLAAYKEQLRLRARFDELKSRLDEETVVIGQLEKKKAELEAVVESKNAALLQPVMDAMKKNAELEAVVKKQNEIMKAMIKRDKELQNLYEIKAKDYTKLEGKYTNAMSAWKETINRLKKAEDELKACKEASESSNEAEIPVLPQSKDLDGDLKKAREEIGRQQKQITELTDEKEDSKASGCS